jgi:Flp pilus assembly protein TadG
MNEPGLPTRIMADESGAALIEFTIVVALLLGLTFALVDFGRAFFQWEMAEKATQMAARLAAVRAPACASVPSANTKSNAATVRYGQSCSDSAEPCTAAAAVSCAGAASSTTATAIFTRIQALLPTGTTVANLRFRYEYAHLGFVGGPYQPIVSVELRDITFRFLVLGPFVRLLGGAWLSGTIAMPPMRAALPAEALR